MGRPAAPHGTRAAARRHQREKSPLCEPCRKALAEYNAGRRQAETSTEDSGPEPRPLAHLPGAMVDDQFVLDARRELLENMALVKVAMSKVAENDPLKIVTLSKRHSELLGELRVLAAGGASSPTPEEADPFDQFFGGGAAAGRPAAAPRTQA